MESKLMTNFRGLWCSLALVAMYLTEPTSHAAEQPDRPNLVFILRVCSKSPKLSGFLGLMSLEPEALTLGYLLWSEPT